MSQLLKVVIYTCGAFLSVRWLTQQLLSVMLYPARRYDSDHTESLRRFDRLFAEMGYALQEVEYQPQRVPCDNHTALLLYPKYNTNTSYLWAVFGGNAMTGIDWLPFFHELMYCAHQQHDAHVRPAFLLVDYPGYGSNNGTPSPKTVLTGQLAAIRESLRYLGSPETINLLGHSLGAAAAAQLAAEWPDNLPLRRGRLVLSAPFHSVDAMAQSIFSKWIIPSWLLSVLVSQHWNNAEWVPKAARAGWRCAIILGLLDEIVPPSMGKALYDALNREGLECTFVEVPNRGHNDMLSDVERYALLMGSSAQKNLDKGTRRHHWWRPCKPLAFAALQGEPHEDKRTRLEEEPRRQSVDKRTRNSMERRLDQKPLVSQRLEEKPVGSSPLESLQNEPLQTLNMLASSIEESTPAPLMVTVVSSPNTKSGSAAFMIILFACNGVMLFVLCATPIAGEEPLLAT